MEIEDWERQIEVEDGGLEGRGKMNRLTAGTPHFHVRGNASTAGGGHFRDVGGSLLRRRSSRAGSGGGEP